MAELSQAELRACHDALVKIVSSRKTGVQHSALLHELSMVPKRAKELATYLTHDYGRGIITTVVNGDEENPTLLALWHAQLSIDKHRERAWPPIKGSGSGPRSPLLPAHVELIDTIDACETAIAHITTNYDIVALDIEGLIPPHGQIDVALIQIAAHDGVVYFFDMLAPQARHFDLSPLLSNPKLRKVVMAARVILPRSTTVTIGRSMASLTRKLPMP
jgi:hypothetical protein